MDSAILFSERQRFRQIWIWLFLLVLDGYLLFKLFKHPTHSQPFNKDFLVPAIVVLVVTVLFSVLRLDTQIREDGVYVRFFPVRLHFRKYPWEDIEKIFIRKYSPLIEYGGWGIRFSLSGKGRALNISGNKGIQLVFSNQARLLIGTNKPEEAALALSNSGHLKE
jgi:hypothetical protein